MNLKYKFKAQSKIFQLALSFYFFINILVLNHTILLLAPFTEFLS